MVLLCVFAVLAWVWLVFCLGFLTRLGLVGKIVVGVLSAVVVGISFTGFAATSRHITIDPTSHRWWWMFSNSLLVVVFYSCLALGLVATVALVMRILAGPMSATEKTTTATKATTSTVQESQATSANVVSPLVSSEIANNASSSLFSQVIANNVDEGGEWTDDEWAEGAEESSPAPDYVPVPRRIRAIRTLSILAIVSALLLTTYGFVVALRPQITQYTVATTELPGAFEGFRIALITDIHLGPTVDGAFVARLVDQVNAEHPDLIVIAGDLVDGTPEQLKPELSVLSHLSAPYGVVVTTGNHEVYWGADEWMNTFAELGLTTLSNSGIQIIRDGQSIDILGIDDSDGKGEITADVQQASTQMAQTFGTPPSGTGRYRILIAHRPNEVALRNGAAARLGVDLELSGHTHGGQLWPFQVLTEFTYGTVSGEAELSNVTVITTRGVANWGPPVRVGAPPEVPIITLTQG